MTTVAPESKVRTAVFFSNDVSMYAKENGPKFSREKNGDLKVTNMPVFRSGTFHDSMGFEHTYDAFQMSQAVMNFDYLKQGILPDVPVRAGHPNPFTNYMHELVGHIDALRTSELTNPSDGEKYTYLLADYTVQDQDAAAKIESGLWRNRSAEIGLYSSNKGQEFFPTLVGFAYVDIPAVEGLNGAFSKYSQEPGIGEKFFLIADTDQEVASVATENEKGTEKVTPPAAPPAVAAHAAAPAVTYVFKIGGQEISDFAAVQAKISQLETEIDTLRLFEKETKEGNRKAFIQKLADDGKVLAADQPELEEFALGLSDAQWASFSSIQSKAPQMALFGKHEVAPQAGGTSNLDQTEEDVEASKARAVYNRLIMGGMAQAQLEQTPSYKLLKSRNLI